MTTEVFCRFCQRMIVPSFDPELNLFVCQGCGSPVTVVRE